MMCSQILDSFRIAFLALKRAFLTLHSRRVLSLSSESVQSTSLALKRVDDVHGGDGLTLGVLRVRDGVTDDVLEEDLEDASCLFVDQTGDSLHSTTPGQTTDGRLRYALDVVSENLAMTLRASLSESLASFASSRHSTV
jgi:hypothetical protein